MARLGLLRALAIMTALCAHVSAFGSEIRHKLDERAARKLVAQGTGYDADIFDYQGPQMSDPFFAYQAVNRPPANAGPWFFAVNPWTGDVWALFGCYRLMTPALHESQAEIKARFTKNELKQYSQLRQLKPFCTVDDSDP